MKRERKETFRKVVGKIESTMSRKSERQLNSSRTSAVSTLIEDQLT